MPALLAVLTWPGNPTRSSLLVMRRDIDGHGFSEAYLQRAYAGVKQLDAAARVIGFIRAAENEAPQPCHLRVNVALARRPRSGTWAPPHEQSLKRLAEQLKANGVVDQELLDQASDPICTQFGRFERLSKTVFGEELPTILTRLQDEV